MTDETRDSEARCPGQELTATCSQDTPPVSGTRSSGCRREAPSPICRPEPEDPLNTG